MVERNLSIRQGNTFSLRIEMRDKATQTAIDLSDATAKMQLRPVPQSSDVVLELSTENNRIVLGGVDGTVTLLVDAETTALLPITKGVYDLEIHYAGGVVKTILFGAWVIVPEVTR